MNPDQLRIPEDEAVHMHMPLTHSATAQHLMYAVGVEGPKSVRDPPVDKYSHSPIRTSARCQITLVITSLCWNSKPVMGSQVRFEEGNIFSTPLQNLPTQTVGEKRHRRSKRRL